MVKSTGNCTPRGIGAGLLEGLEGWCCSIAQWLGQNGIEEALPRLCMVIPQDVLENRLSIVNVLVLDLFHLDWFSGSSLQAQFQLGLGCSVKLLIDSRVVAIESDVGAGRVRESIEANLLIRRNGEQESKL